MSDTRATATALAGLIRRARLDLSTEKHAQADLERALKQAAIAYEREVTLAPGDIVDFLVDGVALEVKLRGIGKRRIFKQLERYAGAERVRAVMLASNISMGLPPEIAGKDAYFVSLGQAWL